MSDKGVIPGSFKVFNDSGGEMTGPGSFALMAIVYALIWWARRSIQNWYECGGITLVLAVGFSWWSSYKPDVWWAINASVAVVATIVFTWYKGHHALRHT